MNNEAITRKVHHIARQAKVAAQKMLANSAADRKQALYAIADDIEKNVDNILSANQKDLDNGRANHLSPALLDRLALTPQRIAGMVNGVRQVAGQADPIGSISDLNVQHNGFKVGKMRTPIGVIGIVYESRPNVTVDAAAICLKSGNACILRGGSEAFFSNSVLVELIQNSLRHSKLDDHMVQFIDTTDRQAVTAMLEAVGLIDVMIPRGGKGLVKLISDKAKVPVIKHLDGLCHVYIDEYADDTIAINVAYNAKTYRYGICGAMETLLIHTAKIDAILPTLIKKYRDKGVELVADQLIADQFSLPLATESDWQTEYLAAKLSIKSVNDIDQAITHINRYGSHHSDAIITDSLTHQNQFLALVDSSSVMVNTATCFADGFEYGLGAEIGISTDKLHVRGPVGVLGLTTEKFIILGNGETRT
ncbi:MAG: glutamate-5-semialdehyde dehydrogenase [Gammaproteobacteria bacterium]|nr:MAG: glutamate-5-semialdehyde dehydrogenase [Gammaproteobacteria bacterium]